MEIYVEGQKVKSFPCLTRGEKLRWLNDMTVRFWGRCTTSGAMHTSASATEPKTKKPESLRQ